MACLAHKQLYWVCSTCTYHSWICCFEVNRSLASMHYDCLMGRNAEFWFAFYLQYNDNFVLQKFIDTFHVQNYLRFLSKHARVFIFLLILRKANESLHPLGRVRKRRKIKWNLSYINGQNHNLQSLFEFALQIEHQGDYSFCIYLNKANVSLKKEKHI